MSQPPNTHLAPDKLLDFYKLAQDVRKYHHSALWEIQKHFTWWVSILLGSLFLLIVNGRYLNRTFLALGIFLTAAFGLAISLIGYRVVRKEGAYFNQALQICNRAAKALGLDATVYEGRQRPEPGADLETKTFTLHPDDYFVKDFSAVDREAYKSLSMLARVLSPKLNVRDYFQIVLLASGALFTVLVCFVILIFVMRGGAFKTGFLADALLSPPLTKEGQPVVDSDRFLQVAVVPRPSGQLTLYAVDESGQVWFLISGSQAWIKMLNTRQLPIPAAGSPAVR